MQKILINTYDEGKFKNVYCGYVLEDTFYREVNNDHYVVKFGGYGIQSDVLGKLLALGVKNVELKTHTGTIMRSKLSSWALNGKRANLGNGEQVFLAIKSMETVNG